MGVVPPPSSPTPSPAERPSKRAGLVLGGAILAVVVGIALAIGVVIITNRDDPSAEGPTTSSPVTPGSSATPGSGGAPAPNGASSPISTVAPAAPDTVASTPRRVPTIDAAGDLDARADAVIERILPLGGEVVLFSHAHLLRVLAARWCGLPPIEGRRLHLSTASVSVLGWEREDAGIERWNHVPGRP